MFDGAGEGVAMNEELKLTAEHFWNRWLAVFAPILLVLAIGLALVDHIAAGTLMAGLFTVVSLLHYLPEMGSFKAFGVEAKFVRRTAQEVVGVLREPVKELTDQRDRLPAEVVPTIDRLNAAFTTANEKLAELVRLEDFQEMYGRRWSAATDPMATSGPDGLAAARMTEAQRKSD